MIATISLALFAIWGYLIWKDRRAERDTQGPGVTSGQCPSTHQPMVPGAVFVVPHVVHCAFHENHGGDHGFEDDHWPNTKRGAK